MAEPRPAGLVVVVACLAGIAILLAPPPPTHPAAEPSRPATWGWVLDGAAQRPWRRTAAAADAVVRGTVAHPVAAGPEGELLGGASDLPVRVWLVRTPPGPGGNPRRPRRIAVVLPDGRYVAGPADQVVTPGAEAVFALRCEGRRFAALELCSTVAAGAGVRTSAPP